jgi:hypothetical protein
MGHNHQLDDHDDDALNLTPRRLALLVGIGVPLDCGSTFLGLCLYGIRIEFNPVIRLLYLTFGTWTPAVWAPIEFSLILVCALLMTELVRALGLSERNRLFWRFHQFLILLLVCLPLVAFANNMVALLLLRL